MRPALVVAAGLLLAGSFPLAQQTAARLRLQLRRIPSPVAAGVLPPLQHCSERG